MFPSIHITKNQILALCLVFLFSIAPAFSSTVQAQSVNEPPQREPIVITLDGVRDAGYIALASDQSADLATPGPKDSPRTQWADLTTLYVAVDATNLYVYASLPGYFYDGTADDSTGEIGLAIDTDGVDGSGGTTDPWGNAITFSYTFLDGYDTNIALLPEYVIRGNVSNDNGYTEFRSWSGSGWNAGGTNWGGISSGHVGTHIAYGLAQGVEFSIPLASLGSPNPANIRLQFFTTQHSGSKGTYDTLPSDDQTAGWDDSTTQLRLVSVPLAVDPDDLSGSISFGGVAWTDVTRLHVWADGETLHLFLPMPDYTSGVSAGQIGLLFDTKVGGGTSDAWGNAITFAHDKTYRNLGVTPVTGSVTLPDFIVRGNIFGQEGGNGWTELRTWNGANWSTGGGADWGGIGNSGSGSTPISKVSWTNTVGLRFHIPYTDLGLLQGDTFNLQFFGTQGGGLKGAYDTIPNDDQSTGYDDATTQKYLATYTLPVVEEEGEEPEIVGACLPGGAAHDNDIWWGDLGHNSRDSVYRTPSGPVSAGIEVTLRLRAACGDLTSAQVRVYDDRTNSEKFYDLEHVLLNGRYEWWETTLPASAEPTIYWYRFIAKDGSNTAFYEENNERIGGWGQALAASSDFSWQLTHYLLNYTTPNWIKDAVVYQIFTDRFYDGESANNTTAGTFFYGESGGAIYRSNTSLWNTAICDPRDAAECPGTWSRNFYGGDLQGITEKLDYLEDLGVTALYLNPIFESPSNHKYDTTNYAQIDDNFGGFAAFEALIDQANDKGIRVILDGVFNHVASDSFYFDRFSRWDAAGTLTSPGGPGTNDASGACESPTSPFRSWFYFTDVTPGTGICASSTGVAKGANYESWFGFDSLPKLNASVPAVRDLIWSGENWVAGADGLARYWMQFADGWRLDVGGDVDPGATNDPNNLYWEGFRNAVHLTNPETYIVGEEWGNGSSWLLGEEWDATMNYQYSTAMMGYWRDSDFVDNDHNQGSSAGIIKAFNPSALENRLLNWLERYAPETAYAQMNLLGSHDTNRALFMLDHNAAMGTNKAPLKNPAYDWSDAITRLKGVVILQMTLPGAPTIYYGDEVGLVGPVGYDNGKWEDDPYNRQPYPWLEAGLGTPFYDHLKTQDGQDELLDHYRLLTAARNAHPALRTGSFDPLLVDNSNDLFAFGRRIADSSRLDRSISDAAVIVVNRDGTLDSPIDHFVTIDVKGYLPVGAQLVDVLSNDIYTVNGDGELVVDVPGQSGAVLVTQGALAAPPAAATVHGILNIGSGFATLDWTEAVGAEAYQVWRSPLSGGGYRWITTTASTIFTDTGLVNAERYYYIVISVDGPTLLEGEPSFETVAVPAHDLTAAWYNLQYPPSIVHTISAITPTELIYGQIFIAGETGGAGPAQGIRAQVGYGLVGSIPDESWMWFEMEYKGASGNNDEYAGSLLPSLTGNFDFTTQFSSDGGITWYLTDLNGPPFSTAHVGSLTVNPSTDTTPPSAPLHLVLDHTSSSSIVIQWDPVVDPDLAGYEVFRASETVVEPPRGESVFLAAVDAETTTYEDTSVDTGKTYTYTVRAFDTSYNKSGFSNEVVGTAEPRLVEVTFRVRVPNGTPGTVYISGSVPEFGPWNPGKLPMTAEGGNLWSTTVQILDGTLVQYKYTRSTWDTVESWGSIIALANRNVTIDYGSNGIQLVDNTAVNWGSGPDSGKAVQYWRDPFVVNVSPTDDAVEVPWDSPIVVTWSITPTAGAVFTVTGPTGVITGTTTTQAAARTSTFTPTSDLPAFSEINVTVTGGKTNGVSGSEAGTQQAPFTASFTTIPWKVYLPLVTR